ncbi:MAG: hypothetical protein ACOCWQ_01840 [Nanoarchaeota archaeon]
MGMNRRGVCYIFDALIFATLLMAAIFLIPPQARTAYTSQSRTAFISKDIIGVLENLKVSELDNPWVDQKIADGSITDPNMSLMLQIGELWAKDEILLANNLTNHTISSLIPDELGSGIWIDGQLVFASGDPEKTHQTSGWRIVSGMEKAKPIQGYVANAHALDVKVNSTRVISISPQGAGWDSGYVEITKYFNLSNMTILSALLHMAVHADPQDSDIWIDFNDGLCHLVRSDFSWENGNSDGNKASRRVDGCVQEGLNKLVLHLRNDWYNAHTHPGMRLMVNYSTDVSLEAQSVDVSRRFYFDDILSIEQNNDKCGVWSMMPFYIPDGATDIESRVQIVARNVRDYTGNYGFSSWDGTWRKRRDYDYTFFMNTGLLDSDASPPNNPVYTYDSAFINPHLVAGTNIITVFFNNYADKVWGKNWNQLYSDQINDPEGSSYVEINYTLPMVMPYGMIDITTIKEFGGSDDHDKIVSFQYPAEAEEKGDVYMHLSQIRSDEVTTWADPSLPITTQVFRSPAKRAVPTTTYIDPSHFDISPVATNYIRVRDDGSGNDITSDSSLEVHFYIPSFVGYGEVFATQADAEADAMARLDSVMGGYLSAGSIVTQFNTITRVPSLWGPATIEVRVWD